MHKLALALTAAGIVLGTTTGAATQEADKSADLGPFDCLIQPSAVIEVAAPVAGVVSEMMVDRGDRVMHGQVLARLEDRLERAAVAVARQRAQSEATVGLRRARLAFEERRVARNQRLIAGKIVTEKEADEIKTSREVAAWELREAEEVSVLARLQLEQAEAELSLREVRSPVDGVVIERNREVGETTAGEHLVRIAKLDPLYVEVFVPAGAVGRFADVDTARVYPEAREGSGLVARMGVIDPVADAASGMLKVRLSVDNADYRELSGLRCSLRLDGTAADATPASSAR